MLYCLYILPTVNKAYLIWFGGTCPLLSKVGVAKLGSHFLVHLQRFSPTFQCTFKEILPTLSYPIKKLAPHFPINFYASWSTCIVKYPCKVNGWSPLVQSLWLVVHIITSYEHAMCIKWLNISNVHNFFYDGFLFMWCNFKFEGFLFRSDSRHNDRVDSLPVQAYRVYLLHGLSKGPHNLTNTGSHLSEIRHWTSGTAE